MPTYRRFLRSKIHRAIVTQADPDYEGSVTIPPELLERADIREYEAVSVWNVTRGTRFDTYAITGQANSTDICVNGAAAHLTEPGDRVIIAAFADIEESMLEQVKPRLLFIGASNGDVSERPEVPGPLRAIN